MLRFFKYHFLFMAIFAYTTSMWAVGTDALSKITITSTNATCVKDPSSQGSFIFTYHDNVHVTFADQSTVAADSLEIVIDGKSKDKTDPVKPTLSKQSSLSSFKQIVFKNNVCFTSDHRKATAQTARFYLQDQRCVLEGGVKIWQAKRNPKDVPIAIDSQKAELNLATGQVKMLGTEQQPVSTTILLEGHPALQKKEKKSKNMKKSKHVNHVTPSKDSGSSAS